MPLPRMTTRRWMIAVAQVIAVVAMVAGLAATAFWFGFSSDEMFHVALGR